MLLSLGDLLQNLLTFVVKTFDNIICATKLEVKLMIIFFFQQSRRILGQLMRETIQLVEVIHLMETTAKHRQILERNKFDRLVSAQVIPLNPNRPLLVLQQAVPITKASPHILMWL